MSRPKSKKTDISPKQLTHRIAELALSKKADDIQILDIREQTTITDFFLICSATTDVQTKAISDAILDGLSPAIKPWHVEGRESRQWILMDFVDVVVHIFQKDAREFYQLERLWADAPCEVIEDSKFSAD